MKTLALNILDIVQNSIRAKAKEISIEISESSKRDQYMIKIADNGSGIPADLLDKITDPFVTTRTTRKTGMGLSLLKQHAEMTGGSLKIESEEGKGTTVWADFSKSHVDRQPLGDMSGVLAILIASNPATEFKYCHKTDTGEYDFSVNEVKETLGIEAISQNWLLNDIKEMIEENIRNIGG